MIRLLFIVVTLFLIGIKLNAQNNVSLSEFEIEKIRLENISKGLNREAGMNSEFLISYQEMKISQEEVEKIVSDLKSNSKTNEVKINTEIFEISIVSKKEQNSPQYDVFKEILAKYNVRVLAYKELTFLSKD